MNKEYLNTLVVKYPFVLGKTQEEIETVFNTLKEYNVKTNAACEAIFKCPKLVSIKLDAKIKETLYLFELYHTMD